MSDSIKAETIAPSPHIIAANHLMEASMALIDAAGALTESGGKRHSMLARDLMGTIKVLRRHELELRRNDLRMENCE